MSNVIYLIFGIIIVISNILWAYASVLLTYSNYWKQIDRLLILAILVSVILLVFGIFRKNENFIILGYMVTTLTWIYINILTPRLTSIRIRCLEQIRIHGKINSVNIDLEQDVDERLIRLANSHKISQNGEVFSINSLNTLFMFSKIVVLLRRIYAR